MHVASIQQPQYFPWLGYFEQIRVCDANMLLDSVQWTKQGRQHRSLIQSQEGKKNWLSIPVRAKEHRTKTIRDMRIDNSQNWKKKHWSLIEAHYRGCIFYKDQLEPILLPWFSTPPCSDYLADNLEESLRLVSETLGINSNFLLSSDYPVPGSSSERLINLCLELEADVYYSSLGSTHYLEVAKFRPHEIRVITQHWRAPDKVGNLSIIHALAEMPLTEIRAALEPKPWSFFGSRAD